MPTVVIHLMEFKNHFFSVGSGSKRALSLYLLQQIQMIEQE